MTCSTALVPTDKDVLCGKERRCQEAPGSIAFRELIDSYVPRYLTCHTRHEKMAVTREIYDIVKQSGRFLKYNQDAKVWEEITFLAARDKVGHSLRFSTRSKRRHMRRTQALHKRIGYSSSNSSVTTVSSSGSLSGGESSETESLSGNKDTVRPTIATSSPKTASSGTAPDMNFLNVVKSTADLLIVLNGMELGTSAAVEPSKEEDGDNLSCLIREPLGDWDEGLLSQL